LHQDRVEDNMLSILDFSSISAMSKTRLNSSARGGGSHACLCRCPEGAHSTKMAMVRTSSSTPHIKITPSAPKRHLLGTGWEVWERRAKDVTTNKDGGNDHAATGKEMAASWEAAPPSKNLTTRRARRQRHVPTFGGRGWNSSSSSSDES
jgi:hypothetical protein